MPKKYKDVKSFSWGKLPSFLLMEICHFSCKSILQILKMSHVSSIWRGHITG